MREPRGISVDKNLRDEYANERPLIKPSVDRMRSLLTNPADVRVVRRGLFELAKLKNIQISAAEQLGEKDSLTGLLNRGAFDRKATELLKRAIRQKGNVTLIEVDLNNLKDTNDDEHPEKGGHQKGDELLIDTADSIGGQIRSGMDIAGRYGGDEFYIAIADATPEEVQKFCDRLIAKFTEKEIFAAIGISRIDSERLEVFRRKMSPMETDRTLVRILKVLKNRADRAMYQAKKQSKEIGKSVSVAFKTDK